MKQLYYIVWETNSNRGTCQVERDEPIVSIEDIRSIEDKVLELCETEGKKPIIVYWRRFESPE